MVLLTFYNLSLMNLLPFFSPSMLHTVPIAPAIPPSSSDDDDNNSALIGGLVGGIGGGLCCCLIIAAIVAAAIMMSKKKRAPRGGYPPKVCDFSHYNTMCPLKCTMCGMPVIRCVM